MQQAEEDAVEATPSNCATWDSIQEVVILGLGSLERSIASRYQLALALLMIEEFSKVQHPVLVRDPVLTELDKTILKECQCQVIHPHSVDPRYCYLFLRNQGTLPVRAKELPQAAYTSSEEL